ncbi:MAG: hypothetical protein H7Y59_03160 [Anaerolineales bacterium]|nr:hypothetical protein [Anaerolineales bacterium]
MKKKRINYSVFILAIILVLLSFSFLRSTVDRTPLLVAFDETLITVISSIWTLITAPTIFIGILIIFLLWKYQSEIVALIPNLRELKAGTLSAVFENAQYPQDKSLEGWSTSAIENTTSPSDINNEIISSDTILLKEIAKMLGSSSSDFLLSLDGKILTVNQSIEIFREKLKDSSISKSIAAQNEREQYLYNYGRYNAFMHYLGHKFVSMDLSEDRKIGHFSLKPGAEKILTDRISLFKEKPFLK